MPTVPMYLQHAQPTDASHGVFAPGGYEWWHFDAEDPSRGLYMAVDFFDGWPFHPIFRERYQRYLRKPTRHAPPVAVEYPCVFMAFYEREKCLATSFAPFAPGSMIASTNNLDVRVGDNFIARDDNIIRINVVGAARSGEPMRVYLLLRSARDSQPREFAIGPLSGGREHWVLTDSMLDVEGQVHLGRHGQVIQLNGRGYHDHFYATGGLATAAHGQLRGRMLTDTGFLAFVMPATLGANELTCVVEARQGEFTEVSAGQPALQRAARFGRVPQSIRIGDMTLDEPENLGFSPLGLRIAYNGGDAQAFCEFVDPAAASAHVR